MDVSRLYRLARQLREVALKASQDGAELPISAGELAVVENVARYPDSTISDISRGTGLAQSRVSTVVRTLSDQGVVECAKDPGDRRQTRVRLHPKLRRQTLRAYGARPVDTALAEAAPHLNRTQLRRAGALLTELADLLTDPADRG